MPKNPQGRLLFGIVIVALLLIIGRNVYRHVREAEFEESLKNGDDTTALTLWKQGVYANQPQQWKRLTASAITHDMPLLACNLLRRGVDPNAGTSDGNPYLASAIETCPDAVKCLLDKGADVNSKRRNFSPLAIAAGRKQIDIARLLLDRGASVNANADTGYTALSAAVQQKDVAMVRLLLEHKAVIAEKMPEENNVSSALLPLSAAAMSGSVDIVELLLAHGVGKAAKEDALLEVVTYKHRDMVQLLLARGAHADSRSLAWQSLYHSAHQARNKDVLELLKLAEVSPTLEKADLNVKIKMGQTVLINAVMQGQTELAQSLIARGADVNAQDAQGRAPLTESLLHCPALVPDLLARGANPNVIAPASGGTPLNLAVNNNDAPTVRLLLKYKADPNVCPPRGHTPLFRARRHNQADIVQILQAAGATEDR